jgi:hypothetical protein
MQERWNPRSQLLTQILKCTSANFIQRNQFLHLFNRAEADVNPGESVSETAKPDETPPTNTSGIIGRSQLTPLQVPTLQIPSSETYPTHSHLSNYIPIPAISPIPSSTSTPVDSLSVQARILNSPQRPKPRPKRKAMYESGSTKEPPRKSMRLSQVRLLDFNGNYGA